MATTTKIYSDISGTTAASSGSEIRNVQDHSKFNKDLTSTGTSPTFSVDSNGNGSAQFETDASITQAGSFTGNALVVGQNKSIYFENISDSDLTIGMEGNLTNEKGLNEVGNILSVATTDKDLTSDERRSIVNYFSRKGGSQTEIYDYQAYDVNSKTPTVSLDFTGNGFYRNLPYYFRLGDTYASFADTFMGNSPKLTYGANSNSTMVNSSGNIVWAPHNLVPYSNDLTSWDNSWGGGVTLTPDDIVGPDGVNSLAKLARIDSGNDGIFASLDLTAGLTYTVSFVAKTGTSTRSEVSLYDLGASSTVSSLVLSWGSPPTTFSATNATDIDYADLGGGFYRISFSMVANTTASHRLVMKPAYSGTSNEYIHFGQAAVYRSDLGGMHPVPGAATGFETYVPTNGAAEYLPRVGHHVYNGSTWVNEGLLIESEPRTNLFQYSDFSSGWTTSGITSTTLDQTGPDGAANTAATLLPSSGGSYHFVRFTTGSSATTYTLSVFARANGYNFLALGDNAASGAGNQRIAFFDLANGSVGSIDDNSTGDVLDATIEPFGDFYRCSVTYVASSALHDVAVSSSDGARTFSADGTSSVIIYGAQLEAAPTPSSYIPTNGQPGGAPRTAQSLTVPAHWYNADNPTPTGPELVTDFSTYASDADFFADGYVRSDAAKATFDPVNDTLDLTDGVNVRIDGHVSFVEGATYQVSITNDGPDVIYFQDNYTNFSKGIAAGTDTFVFTKGPGANVRVVISAGNTASISNVSVRQVSAPQFGWPEPEYIGLELADGSQLDKRSGTDGTVSRAGGIISFTPAATGLSTAISEEITGLTVGKVYEFRGRARSLTAGIGLLQLRSGSGGGGSTLATSSTSFATSFADCSIIYKATGTSVHLSYLPAAGQGIEIVEASHSFREINPLSVSIQMDGRMTYVDEDTNFTTVTFVNWEIDTSNYIRPKLDTYDVNTGKYYAFNRTNGTNYGDGSEAAQYQPGVLTPFNIAGRWSSTEVKAGQDGIASGSPNTTVSELLDLSNTNLQIAYDFMGTIGQFRQFAGDIGDTGLATSTEPSTEPTLSLTFDTTGGSFYNLSWSE